MQRKHWTIVGAVVAGLAVVVAAGWFFFLRDDAPPKPTLDKNAAVDAGATSPDGTWKVVQGPDVYVGYRINELFAGESIKKTAVGRTTAVNGTVSISGTEVTGASVSADLRELQSDSDRRDSYIRENGLQSDTFPTASFALTEPLELPQPIEKGAAVTLPGTGTLTLHGVEQTVTVDLEARWLGDTLEIVGTIPIRLADYKITPPKTPLVGVDGEGSIEIKLVLKREVTSPTTTGG